MMKIVDIGIIIFQIGIFCFLVYQLITSPHIINVIFNVVCLIIVGSIIHDAVIDYKTRDKEKDD